MFAKALKTSLKLKIHDKLPPPQFSKSFNYNYLIKEKSIFFIHYLAPMRFFRNFQYVFITFEIIISEKFNFLQINHSTLIMT